MSYGGQIVVDMDSHIREYVDFHRTYRDHIDPQYRDAYEQLAAAVTSRQTGAGEQVLFMNPQAVVAPTPPRRPLGVRDVFAAPRSAANGAPAPQTRSGEIDPACAWDASIRLRDMDTAGIDISILFASQADGFCVLRDVGFEQALNRAYHRYVSDYCAEADGRLRWVVNATMRRPEASADELTYWAERDPNVAGMFISRACPDGRLLDNPDLFPIYQRAQDLDLPVLVHGGTMRPPLTPGATELDNAGFIINAVYHGWGGMTAAAALIGGGIFDRFPRLRIGLFESGAGWMPWLIEKLDDSYRPGSSLTPFLTRTPSEVVAEGRLFCSIEPGEELLGHCVEHLGDDIWLFTTDYPHTGSCWPDGVPLVANRAELSATTKAKILGGNALRFLPRLAG